MVYKRLHIVGVLCGCLMLLFVSLDVSAQQAAPTPSPTPQKQPPTPSLWQRLSRILGLTATPSTQKGPGDDEAAGEVWVVDLSLNSRLKLTQTDSYHSPIFAEGDKSILAFKGDEIVKIPVSGGKTRKLATVKGASKLIGVDRDNQRQVLVLSEEQDRISLRLLSLTTGKMTVVPFDEQSRDDRRTIAHLRGWERVYDDSKVYARKETKNTSIGLTEWTDVYFKRGDSKPVNVSSCDGINCGQPSLSQNKKFLVYIKTVKM
jgi:hypothetical protein